MATMSGLVRSVSWRELCPWIILFRSFRLSIGAQLLLIGALGSVLIPAGWRVAASFLVSPDDPRISQSVKRDAEYFSRWPCNRDAWLVPRLVESERQWFSEAPVQFLTNSAGFVLRPYLQMHNAPFEPLVSVVYRIVRPFYCLFHPDLGWRELAYYLAGGFWTLVVWGWLGGYISRVAAVYLGREERIGFHEAFDHARRKFPSHLGTVYMPLMGIAVSAAPLVILGWCMRAEWGIVLAGIVWILVLFAGFLMLILALGLLFGWPLMWGTISSEGSDAFDAISRSYAYTFQRPIRYLLYCLIAGILGLLGWLLVWGASEAVIFFGFWGTGWGSGRVRMLMVIQQIDADNGIDDLTLGWRFGMTAVGLAVGFVRTLASAYAYSYFWCAATGIYLLLRRDCDNTELDDIYIEDEKRLFDLPDLTNDKTEAASESEDETKETEAASD